VKKSGAMHQTQNEEWGGGKGSVKMLRRASKCSGKK